MNIIREIRNEKTIIKLLSTQIGEILGILTGLVLGAFFVDLNTLRIVLFGVIPVIIILIFSKYNKPVIKVKIDTTHNLIYFKVAFLGQYSRTIIIPFSEILITKKAKWSFRSYGEVIEIKQREKTRIVILIYWEDSNFINCFVNELMTLKDSKQLGAEQIKIKSEIKH